MQQVLEAPEIQVEEREPTVIATGGRVKVVKSDHSIFKRRPILSVLKHLGQRDVPPCAEPGIENESAIDYICRVDPYLYIKSLVG